MDQHQRALAAEIRAEMGAQNVKAAPIQRALGISSTAWGTYFVQCTRDVPISVIAGVAEYLGLKTSELLRRAEARAAAEQHGAGPRVDVDKILRDAPELAAVRAEGQRVAGVRRTATD